MFIEFGAPFLGFSPQARDYPVTIEVKLGHKENWHPLVSFTLRAAHIIHPTNYIAYSNSPHDLTEEDRKKADAALADLAVKLQQKEGNSGQPEVGESS
jgi:hypothetical protein